MKVYAVVMTFKSGRKGYHSVWSTKDGAERQVAIHGGKWRQEYSVEEKEPIMSGDSYCGRTCVRFEDSVGWMILERHPRERRYGWQGT